MSSSNIVFWLWCFYISFGFIEADDTAEVVSEKSLDVSYTHLPRIDLYSTTPGYLGAMHDQNDSVKNIDNRDYAKESQNTHYSSNISNVDKFDNTTNDSTNVTTNNITSSDKDNSTSELGDNTSYHLLTTSIVPYPLQTSVPTVITQKVNKALGKDKQNNSKSNKKIMAGVKNKTTDQTFFSTTDNIKFDDKLINTNATSRLQSENSISTNINLTKEKLRVDPNPPISKGFRSMDIAIIAVGGILVIAITAALGMFSVMVYRRYHWNKPQTFSDKCSNADSTGYIDDSTFKENSEEMYSLDNDSFLNSLEAMTIQNYWVDSIRHTKL